MTDLVVELEQGAPHPRINRLLGSAADEIKRLRAALRDIAHGNWSFPAADSEAANVYAQIVSEMQARASVALSSSGETIPLTCGP